MQLSKNYEERLTISKVFPPDRRKKMTTIFVKKYANLSEEQNKLINADITRYLSFSQKKLIEKKYKDFIKKKEPVNIRAISAVVDEPSYLIRQYLIKRYGNRIIDKFYYNGCYLDLCESVEKKQYVRFTDFNYKRSQYIVAKELGVEVEKVREFVIHHINANTFDDSFTNLLPLLDNSMHIKLHSIKGNVDLQEYIYDYIDNELLLLEEKLSEGKNSEDIGAVQASIDKLNRYSRLIELYFMEQKDNLTVVCGA